MAPAPRDHRPGRAQRPAAARATSVARRPARGLQSAGHPPEPARGLQSAASPSLHPLPRWLRVGALGLALVLGTLAWRWASRRWSLPCPAWLAWVLEGDLADRLTGTATTLDRLGLAPGLRVLEVGPGPGRLAIPAARRVLPHGAVVGIDIQPAMLDRLRARAAAAGVTNLTALHGDARDLPLASEQFDLVFDHGGATLKLFQGNDGQAAGGTYNIVPSPELLHADGMSFVIPVVLGHPRKTQLVGEDGKVILPLALPAEASLRMFLVDADDVHTTEPSRLGLVGRLDEPPKIDVQARGVDAVITRKALIPVAGTIVDDYGVVQARFEYKVDAADQFTPRPMSRAARGEKEFRLAMSDAQPFERFEVLPLQLTVGQRLAIAVFAEDGDDLTGPHGTHSVAVTYEIVSEEELLSRLYGRELNLRERFERILEETKATRADLAAHQAPLNEYEQMRREPAGAGDAAARTQRMDELQDAVIGSVERARQGVGKNHNETRSVEQGFRDIREEMVNNVVDTPESLSRLDEKLILPLHGINETDFPGVDDELGLYRLALGENRDAAGLLDETLDRMDLMILHMEQVLTEMRRMETFKELVELLKAIKAQQDALKEETERERKRRILEGLE